jgi:hypothetical protein
LKKSASYAIAHFLGERSGRKTGKKSNTVLSDVVQMRKSSENGHEENVTHWNEYPKCEILPKKNRDRVSDL